MGEGGEEDRAEWSALSERVKERGERGPKSHDCAIKIIRIFDGANVLSYELYDGDFEGLQQKEMNQLRRDLLTLR